MEDANPQVKGAGAVTPAFQGDDGGGQRICVLHLRPPRVCRDGVEDYQQHLLAALGRAVEAGAAAAPRVRVEAGPIPAVRARRGAAARGTVGIVHVQAPMIGFRFDLGLALKVRRLARAEGWRVVLTLHEWGRTRGLRRMVLRPFFGFADRLVFPSRSVRDEVRAACGGRIAGRDAVIPIGPNIVLSDEELAALPMPPRRPGGGVIGHFGFLYASKHPERLLAVLRHLRRQGDFRLRLVGDFLDPKSPEARRFHHLKQSWGLDEAVEMCGYLEHPRQVMERLAECDVVLLLHEEGFSVRHGSTLATLQLGLPAVALEPVRPFSAEEAAWLERLDVHRHLTLLPRELDEEGIADVVGRLITEQGRGRVRRSMRWVWDEVARRHLELYRELANGGAGEAIGS